MDSHPCSNHCDPEHQHVQQEAQSNVRTFYTLPKARYSVLTRFLVFVGSVTVITLWVTGGDNDYFINSITNFTFLYSVFDLAVMAAAKVIILFTLYHLMEKYTLRQIEDPYERPLEGKKNTTHILTILLSLLLLIYVTVKGGFILYHFMNGTSFASMHKTYAAAIGCAFGFNLLEFLISVGSFKAMRRLKIIRILHRMNNNGVLVDENGKAITKPATLKRVIGLAKPETGLLSGGILFMLVSSGSQMISPLFFGHVIDAAQKSMAELNQTILILLAINVTGAIAAMFRSWLFTLSGQRLVARLRSHLFNSIIRQEVAFFDITRTGELTNRLSSDTQVIQNAVTVNISMLTRNLLQIIGSLVIMFVLNPALTGVLLSVVPIISVIAVIYGRYLQRLQKTFQDRLADASTTAEEVISSIRTVRTFTSEKKASNTYWSDIDKSYQIGKKLAMVIGGFEGFIGILSGGAIVLVLWYGGKLVSENIISAGIVTSFVLYTLQVAIAFGTMTALYGDFMKAVGASSRIFELMDRLPEIPLEGGLKWSKLSGSIQFNKVHFTYPSRPETEILKGVSFSVEPGQMVALVGPSGGGKSTIVNMIERFYDPNHGTILLDNMKVSDLDPAWYRSQISMVSQEPTLFACSIKDNILYGKDASMEEVISAAKQANAHEFIMSFDEGYDTLVGERGVRLSGGQKQRVAIARALIMNPIILLLDEATSALDAESEHLVQEAIDRAMVNRTVIVIAHRLSTVRNANQVIVIDKGVIGEQGTHEELLAKNGIYKKLILRQLTAGSMNMMVETDDVMLNCAQDHPGNKDDDVDMIDLNE